MCLCGCSNVLFFSIVFCDKRHKWYDDIQVIIIQSNFCVLVLDCNIRNVSRGNHNSKSCLSPTCCLTLIKTCCQTNNFSSSHSRNHTILPTFIILQCYNILQSIKHWCVFDLWTETLLIDKCMWIINSSHYRN